MIALDSDSLDRSLRRHIIIGLSAATVMIGGFGGWSAIAELAGAVIAPGTIVVEGNVRKVQHPSGGVVAEIRVREGQRIQAGDVLLRLNETATRANLAMILKSLDQMGARRARLEAERDGAETVTFPPELKSRIEAGDKDALAALNGEQKLFESRRDVRKGKTLQLRRRIAQFEEQVRGLTAQEQGKIRELSLIQKELAGVRELLAKGFAPATRANALEREEARLSGERGRLISSQAEARDRIAEINLQIIQIDQDLRGEVATELRDLVGKQGEQVERRTAAEDQLRRVDLKATVNGVVHQLLAHTIDGVITAGADIMTIVPDGESLTIEARVLPTDIDQLRLGQDVRVLLTAFNRNRTPELVGSISLIAPDLVTDPKTGVGYYRVGISIADSERTRLGTLQLVPGMPVETHIRTDARTVLSYLMRPLRDHAARVFRDDY